MSRLILLLTLLGVTHCHWGFNFDGSDSDSSGPDSDDSDFGPSNKHGYHHGRFHGHGHGHHQGHNYGHHGNGCNHHGNHNHSQTWHSEYDRIFEKLSGCIICIDRHAKYFCERYIASNVEEWHGNTPYKVSYSMPQCDPKNIAVKIRHRVLYMYARQSNREDSPTYVDIKVLPDSLKVSDAVWTYTNDVLTIIIPYIDVHGRAVKKCVDVNADVKVVPEVSPH